MPIDNKDIQNNHEILAYIEGKKNVGDDIFMTVHQFFKANNPKMDKAFNLYMCPKLF